MTKNLFVVDKNLIEELRQHIKNDYNETKKLNPEIENNFQKIQDSDKKEYFDDLKKNDIFKYSIEMNDELKKYEINNYSLKKIFLQILMKKTILDYLKIL